MEERPDKQIIGRRRYSPQYAVIGFYHTKRNVRQRLVPPNLGSPAAEVPAPVIAAGAASPTVSTVAGLNVPVREFVRGSPPFVQCASVFM